MRPAAARLLGIAGLLGILALTLVPIPELVDPKHDLRGWYFSLSDLFVNIVLFLPVGIGMALAGRGFRASLGVAAGLSVGIELTQWLIPGRSTDLMDVVANTAGAALGFALVSVSPVWLAPDLHTARRLSCAAGFCVALLLFSAGWLLGPSLPGGQYFVHAPPEVVGLDPFSGTLHSLVLNGRPLQRNRISDSERVRVALSGDFELHVRASGGGPRGPRTGMLMISAARDDVMLLLLTLESDDLVFQYRDRAAWLRLEPAWLVAKGALRGLRTGDEIDLVVRRHAGRICLLVGAVPTCDLEPTVGDAWSVFVPQLLAVTGTARPIGMLWIALLALPLGYWSRWDWASALVWTGVASTLLAIPMWTPMRSLEAVDAAAAIVGLLAGMALARLAQASDTRAGA